MYGIGLFFPTATYMQSCRSFPNPGLISCDVVYTIGTLDVRMSVPGIDFRYACCPSYDPHLFLTPPHLFGEVMNRLCK